MDYFLHESSYIDENVTIGNGTKIWHFCHVQKNAYIGEHCILGQNVYIGQGVQVGNHVKLQNNVSVYDGVTLEDYVFCGPSMVFTNDLSPRSKFPKGLTGHIPTRVKEGASIGANATVVCGITIGRWSMIAAGSVVTKDVPDFALMVGLPARQRGWVCMCGLSLHNQFVCDECGRKYSFNEEKNTVVLLE